MADHNKDEQSGVETTGHEWDGIKELNNPLPRWWLWIFYGTIIWSIGYMIAYPAIPLLTDATRGVLGYSSRASVAAEIAAVEAEQADILGRVAEASLEEIRQDAELFDFAIGRGAGLFRTHCTTCHGSGAAGAVGYPNLNDDAWIWGGSLDAIAITIAHGVRQTGADGFPTAETRFSAMPAFGDLGILKKSEIRSVAEHVRSLSGLEADAELAALGAPLYAQHCASCHGADGAGNRELGAPTLSDQIWLYGGDRDALIATITHSRAGMMPSWTDKIGEAGVKSLTVYVHALGGGE